MREDEQNIDPSAEGQKPSHEKVGAPAERATGLGSIAGGHSRFVKAQQEWSGLERRHDRQAGTYSVPSAGDVNGYGKPITQLIATTLSPLMQPFFLLMI